MAVILATSRLTLCTSSSVSCCNNCALGPSPRTTRSMAALRSGDASPSTFTTFMIIGCSPRWGCAPVWGCAPGYSSIVVVPDPAAQYLHGDFGLLGDLVSQVFGEYLGLLGDDRRQFE